MADLHHEPVPHDHDSFLDEAARSEGFTAAFAELDSEYALTRELLAARVKAGLTQEAVARLMGTTKSAVSRLEGAGKYSPSISTLRKYARAVGCELRVSLAEDDSSRRGSAGPR